MNEKNIEYYGAGFWSISDENSGTKAVEVGAVDREMKRLEGKCLTILEASIDNNRQLEALKSILRQELGSSRSLLTDYFVAPNFPGATDNSSALMMDDNGVEKSDI